MCRLQEQIDQIVEDKILEALCGPDASGDTVRVMLLALLLLSSKLSPQMVSFSTPAGSQYPGVSSPACKARYSKEASDMTWALGSVLTSQWS